MWLGVVVTGPAIDCVFGFDFFMVFKAVACTRVLTSCDDAKGGVTAGLRLSMSLGKTGFVDVVFEPDFTLRAML